MTLARDDHRERSGATALRQRGDAKRQDTDDVHRRIDAGLALLLAVQALTIFVVVPLSARHAEGRLLLNLSNLAFTAVCIRVLVRRRFVQFAFIVAIMTLVAAPFVEPRLALATGISPLVFFEMIAAVAFAFNATVTLLVGRHVFGPGKVTAHRIQGAILVYLNVSTLCSIAFIALTNVDPHAIASTTGASLPSEIGTRVATLTYFSLTTITTTGFGDLVPLHPIARSLANLESVFGHLFPATLLARLVALHVAHNGCDDQIDHPDRI